MPINEILQPYELKNITMKFQNKKNDFAKIDKNTINQLQSLTKQGLSVKNIAQSVDVSYSKIRTALKHFDIPTKQAKASMHQKDVCEYIENGIISMDKLADKKIFRNTHDSFIKSIDKADLQELKNNGHSVKDIAIMLATNAKTVIQLFKKFNI